MLQAAQRTETASWCWRPPIGRTRWIRRCGGPGALTRAGGRRPDARSAPGHPEARLCNIVIPMAFCSCGAGRLPLAR